MYGSGTISRKTLDNCSWFEISVMNVRFLGEAMRSTPKSSNKSDKPSAKMEPILPLEPVINSLGRSILR